MLKFELASGRSRYVNENRLVAIHPREEEGDLLAVYVTAKNEIAQFAFTRFQAIKQATWYD